MNIDRPPGVQKLNRLPPIAIRPSVGGRRPPRRVRRNPSNSVKESKRSPNDTVNSTVNIDEKIKNASNYSVDAHNRLVSQLSSFNEPKCEHTSETHKKRHIKKRKEKCKEKEKGEEKEEKKGEEKEEKKGEENRKGKEKEKDRRFRIRFRKRKSNKNQTSMTDRILKGTLYPKKSQNNVQGSALVSDDSFHLSSSEITQEVPYFSGKDANPKNKSIVMKTDSQESHGLSTSKIEVIANELDQVIDDFKGYTSSLNSPTIERKHSMKLKTFDILEATTEEMEESVMGEKDIEDSDVDVDVEESVMDVMDVEDVEESVMGEKDIEDSGMDVAPKIRTESPVDRIEIHESIRYQVWRLHNGGMMDGKCFICAADISIEKWNCVPILCEIMEPSSMRPLCDNCFHSGRDLYSILTSVVEPGKEHLISNLVGPLWTGIRGKVVDGINRLNALEISESERGIIRELLTTGSLDGRLRALVRIELLA
jgi:hypothetical protein